MEPLIALLLVPTISGLLTFLTDEATAQPKHFPHRAYYPGQDA